MVGFFFGLCSLLALLPTQLKQAEPYVTSVVSSDCKSAWIKRKYSVENNT